MNNKMAFEIVTLNWIKAEPVNFPAASGIYQIYGTSPLYGMNTLLYIGKAKNLNYRINQHFEFKEGVIGRQPNKSCMFATIDESLLDVVEQTLIAMHKPSFNSTSVANVSPIVKQKPYYLQNHGERGMLNIEVTNFYFLNPINGNEVEFEVLPVHEDL